jgi:hypothetical protein
MILCGPAELSATAKPSNNTPSEAPAQAQVLVLVVKWLRKG